MLSVLPLALSAGQKAGLAVVAGLFIGFALLSALVLPSRWPDFPGRTGLRPFVVATVALFLGMMLAVFFLARESEHEAEAGGHETNATETEATTTGAGAARTVTVSEVDYRIELPSPELDGPSSYTLRVQNDGRVVHNLVVSGPEVNNATTPAIQPGGSAALQVTLVKGTYELYCSIPGHKELGMSVELDVT